MKNIKKSVCLFILFCMAIFLLTTKSQATGSISLSSSKSSVNVGDEFNISVNLSGASVATLTTRITIDTSKVEYVSGPSNTNFSNGKVIYTWTDSSGGSNPKTDGVIATFKFKAKASGTASFSVSGEFYSSDEVSLKPSFSGTSVTVKEKTTVTPTTPSTGNNQTGGNTTTSGNNSNTNNVTNTGNTTTGGSNSSGNSNTGTTSGNNSTGSTGNTSNNGTGSSSTQTLSTNANLKELHLGIEGLSPAFQKTITQYNIIVGNDVNQISINAIAEDSNAKVAITGNTNLKTGVNQIKIVVTAQDGKTTKTYNIEATKTENPDLANANLENLAIENVTLEPEFSQDITQYNAIIGSDVDSIHILAVPQIEGATVEITGADNIQFGDNLIKIKVTAKDGVTDKEYSISLYKTTVEEENEDITLTDEEEQNEEQNESKVSAGQIVFCIIVIASVVVAIFLLIRNYKKGI
jgi:hypothetical protein